MANLDVQPKKKGSILPWILLALGLLALLFFLFKGCGKDNKDAGAATSDSATTATTVNSDNSGWDSIDFNGPTVNYEEITDTSINVRGNNNYGIYGLGENILFDIGKSEIRS